MGGTVPRITEDCISCGICADECPNGAIIQTETQYVIDQELCTECGICESVCPRRLIVLNEEERSERRGTVSPV